MGAQADAGIILVHRGRGVVQCTHSSDREVEQVLESFLFQIERQREDFNQFHGQRIYPLIIVVKPIPPPWGALGPDILWPRDVFWWLLAGFANIVLLGFYHAVSHSEGFLDIYPGGQKMDESGI